MATKCARLNFKLNFRAHYDITLLYFLLLVVVRQLDSTSARHIALATSQLPT